MLSRSRKAPLFKRPILLAGLASLAITTLGAGALATNGLPGTKATTPEPIAVVVAETPDAQDLLAARSADTASRGEVRSEVPDLAQTSADAETGTVLAEPAEATETAGATTSTDASELLTVDATPAPEYCTYTGLTDLPDNDPLCSDPANNTPDQNRELGRYLAAQRGWTGSQFQCLDNLFFRESNWRHAAANPISSARGIPQRMMSVHYGANWRTSATAAAWLADPEAQIEWGLDYISGRYGNPCGAWAHSQRTGWY